MQLVISDWQHAEAYKLQLSGLNVDIVLENIVKQVGHIQLDDGTTLTEQIAADVECVKREKQIEVLEKRCRAEKQAHKKYELHKQIRNLKELIK